MRIDKSRLFLTVLFALFLSACKTVTVTNPVANQVYTSAPSIQLSFPKGKPDPLVVTLNDSDITSLLTVTDSGATASGDAIKSLLVDGDNFLRVTKPVTPTVKFIYDISGPMVHVTKVTEGSSLNIQGYVEDPSGIKSVTVNGAAVALATGNAFNVNVTNGNFVTFVSTDNNNYVRTQNFARPNVTADNSVSLRINRHGLDFVTNEVEAMLQSSALGKLIAGMNPMKHECILGNCYDINVKDASLRTADLNLGIQPAGDGSLAVSGNMTGIWASYQVVISPLIGWAFNIDGEANVDRADFTASAKVTIDASHKVNVAISSLNLSLGTLSANVGVLPSWLVSPFLNAFKFIVEWILEEQLKQILPAKLAEMVDAFPSSLLIEINGSQLKPSILPTTLSSPNNGLNLGLGARLYNVTTTGPKVVGSPWKTMGNAPAASTVSPSGVEKDVGVVVSGNVINQALSAATASGMLNISLTDSQIPALLGMQGVDPTQHARVRLVPASAPTLELVKSSNGLAIFRMHDVYLALEGTLDSSGQMKLVMGATIDVEAKADLGVTNGNALAVEFAGTPRIKVRSIDSNSTLLLSADLAQVFMDELTPMVLPVVMSAIGAFPLPSFEGYGLNVGDIWVTDSSANFIGLVADMVKVTTTASAPAPITYASVANATTSTQSGLYSATSATSVDVSGKVVTINLDGYNPSEGDLSYRYSVDGAPFSVWKARKSIRLYGLKAGQHQVTVCSRTALLVEDADCTTVSVNVTK